MLRIPHRSVRAYAYRALAIAVGSGTGLQTVNAAAALRCTVHAVVFSRITASMVAKLSAWALCLVAIGAYLSGHGLLILTMLTARLTSMVRVPCVRHARMQHILRTKRTTYNALSSPTGTHVRFRIAYGYHCSGVDRNAGSTQAVHARSCTHAQALTLARTLQVRLRRSGARICAVRCNAALRCRSSTLRTRRCS
jgi:hypothetical protein